MFVARRWALVALFLLHTSKLKHGWWYRHRSSSPGFVVAAWRNYPERTSGRRTSFLSSKWLSVDKAFPNFAKDKDNSDANSDCAVPSSRESNRAQRVLQQLRGGAYYADFVDTDGYYSEPPLSSSWPPESRTDAVTKITSNTTNETVAYNVSDCDDANNNTALTHDDLVLNKPVDDVALADLEERPEQATERGGNENDDNDMERSVHSTTTLNSATDSNRHDDNGDDAIPNGYNAESNDTNKNNTPFVFAPTVVATTMVEDETSTLDVIEGETALAMSAAALLLVDAAVVVENVDSETIERNKDHSEYDPDGVPVLDTNLELMLMQPSLGAVHTTVNRTVVESDDDGKTDVGGATMASEPTMSDSESPVLNEEEEIVTLAHDDPVPQYEEKLDSTIGKEDEDDTDPVVVPLEPDSAAAQDYDHDTDPVGVPLEEADKDDDDDTDPVTVSLEEPGKDNGDDTDPVVVPLEEPDLAAKSDDEELGLGDNAGSSRCDGDNVDASSSSTAFMEQARQWRARGKRYHDQGNFGRAAATFGRAATTLMPLLQDDEMEYGVSSTGSKPGHDTDEPCNEFESKPTTYSSEDDATVSPSPLDVEIVSERLVEYCTLRLHQALCALKAHDYDMAVTATSAVIETTSGGANSDGRTMPVVPAPLRARALYRRAKARLGLLEQAQAMDHDGVETLAQSRNDTVNGESGNVEDSDGSENATTSADPNDSADTPPRRPTEDETSLSALALSDARAAAFLGDGKAVELYGKLLRSTSGNGGSSILNDALGASKDSLSSTSSSSSSSSSWPSTASSQSLLQQLLASTSADTASKPSQTGKGDMGSFSPTSLLSSVLLGSAKKSQGNHRRHRSSGDNGGMVKSLWNMAVQRLDDPAMQETICSYLQGTSETQLLQWSSLAGLPLQVTQAQRLVQFCHSVSPKGLTRTMGHVKRVVYVVQLVRALGRVLHKYRTWIVLWILLWWIKSAIMRPLPVRSGPRALAAGVAATGAAVLATASEATATAALPPQSPSPTNVDKPVVGTAKGGGPILNRIR
jgi:hypothetical protein